MSKKNLIDNNLMKSIMLYLILFLIMVIGISFYSKYLPKSSFGADNEKIVLNTNLEKYINYKISNQDKGTLIQYNVKVGIESDKNEEQYVPLKQSQIKLEFNQIDGKYPYSVKIIPISTEATNGKTKELKEDYRYSSEIGTLVINASNLNENEELINTEKNTNVKDEYIVIAYYDTYIEELEEREINIKETAVGVLSDDDRLISIQEEFKGKVRENIGELTSIENTTQDIYNGNIKSNIINRTEYNTQYKETQKIIVSKKEVQDRIYVSEDNELSKIEKNEDGEEIETNLGNNNDLIYKSTKIKKEDIIKLLGYNGKIDFLDQDQNILFTIDNNTEFDYDGSITINYETDLKSLYIRTSKIQNEGILEIENTKEIKNTIKEAFNTQINTSINIWGINERIVNNTNELDQGEEYTSTIERKVAYNNKKENTIEIKDSKTNIDFNINDLEWTNKEQNEILFDVNLNSNSIKDNMFKDPKIEIELPKEVEKVILGDSHIIYGNGLELNNVKVQRNEEEKFIILADIEGSQTGYNENPLELKTTIHIPATIILKKEIENLKDSINLTCNNNYTLDGNAEVINKKYDIQILSYKEDENTKNENQSKDNVGITQNAVISESPEQVEGLKMEVVPVKGDTILKDGDTVYEGEFIKYNIKVTNTSGKKIDNVKVVGTIPEGTVYGELEADYHTSRWLYEEKYNKEVEDELYKYNYDENVKVKNLDLNSIAAGESKQVYFEVRANDLEQSEEKETFSKIEMKVDDTTVSNYQINNLIKHSDAKVYVSSYMDAAKNDWCYIVKIEAPGEVNLKLKLPKEYELDRLVNSDKELTISKDNIITVKLSEGEYTFTGNIDNKKFDNEKEKSIIELIAIATIEYNNKLYNSNENRILYEYENVSVEMTSENEGEEIQYNDEINYQIKVRNIGSTNLKEEYLFTTINLKDYLPREVIPSKVTYENYEREIVNYNEETNGYTFGDEYKKITKEIDISGRYEDTMIPDLDLNLNIPEQETLNINISTKAGIVTEKTKIENTATVTGNDIATKTSNTVTHIILPVNYAKVIPENPDDPSNPDEPDIPNIPDDPSEDNQKYSISGVAWLDENQDGQKQNSEKLMSGIDVMLVDANSSSTILDKQTTNKNGEYIFSNIEKGKYIVVFMYDTDQYSLTDYRKEGISSSLNSDAMNEEITISSKKVRVGLTDILAVNASIKNIDVGFIKNKICDLKLDKYISKVTVKTVSGTKEYSYDNSQLAKVELKSKEIQGATVIVEYKIVVSNEGEIPTSVNKVIDYIPDGLKFSSELNKNWSMNKNGELINESLSNTKIEVGKRVELDLILTKSMTVNSTGTFSNIAEIGEINNTLKVKDNDSTPANKVQTEDDYSKADLIISVSTGALLYISITIGVILFIGIIVFLSIKFGYKKVSKASLLIALLVVCILGKINDVNAETVASEKDLNVEQQVNYGYYHENTVDLETYNYFMNNEYINFHRNQYQAPTKFGALYENETRINDINGNQVEGRCITRHADPALNGRYTRYKWNEYIIKDIPNPNFSDSIYFAKTEGNDEEIRINSIDDDYIIGPLRVEGDSNNNYNFQIQIDNRDYKNAEICNVNGIKIENFSTSKDRITSFYLKLNKNVIQNGQFITGIKGTASRDVTSKKIVEKKACAKYKLVNTNYQNAEIILYLNTEEIKKDKKSIDEYWGIKRGNLQIEKVDKDNSNVKISGVQFKVTGPSYPEGIELTTGSNGKTEKLNDILAGNYTIQEMSNENYGYTTVTSKNISVNAGMDNNTIIENRKETGNLIIEKRDTEQQDKKLEGVTFNIRAGEKTINGETNPDKGKYIKITQAKDGEGFDSNSNKCTGVVHIQNMTFVDNEKDATKFTTDEDGMIIIYNILRGYYDVEEIDVGEEYSIYDIDEQYISWEFESMNQDWTELNKPENEEDKADAKKSAQKSKVASIRVFKRNSANTTENKNLNLSANAADKPYDYLIFNNKRKYIRLSGYVWEDVESSAKTSYRNDLFETNIHPETQEYKDNKDVLKGNILVKLKDKTTGEVIKETTTSEQTGKYQFDEIIIENLSNYYIEFEYDGLIYANIKSYKELVSQYGTSRENTTQRDYINKVTVDNTSKAIENDNSRQAFNDRFAEIKGRTSDTGVIVGTDQREKYIVDYENGDHISTWKNIEGLEQGIKTTMSAATYDIETKQEQYSLDQYEPEMEEIENINLGLYRREMPDISLVKDLSNVEIDINGKSHIYQYEQRFMHNNDNEYGDGFNIGVKFGNKYGSASYTRAIYKADAEYTNNNDNSKELKMYVTYRIKIKNQSSNLKVKVNSIVDYYDSNYKLIDVGSNLSENGEILNKLTNSQDSTYNNDKYSKSIIYMNDDKIDDGKESDIYVKFELNRESVLKLLNNGENLNNVAEINSYTVYKDNKLYAGIDEDSNPGNAEPGNKTTYEDDTDEAPGLKLEVSDARVISGKVFLDSSETTENKERKGTGIYEEGESGIENVQVTMINSEGTVANIYDTETKKWKQATVNTGADGNFNISGFIPGDYNLVYTWGDEKYTVQNYKGTVWNDENVEEKNEYKNDWYKHQTVDSKGNIIRYSDAKDNYNIPQNAPKGSRIQIDEETKNTESTQYTRNKMDSITNEMNIGVEYETTYTSSIGDKYTYEIDNVDFGIVERPKQALEVNKRVDNLKLISGKGQTIIDANVIYDENDKQYKLENETKYVTYMPPSKDQLQANGSIKVELDDEYVQDSKVYIKYKITVKNQSEIDYNSENYYLYGKLGDNENASDLIVKLKPLGIYDYYDNDMTFHDNDNNGKWELINYTDYSSEKQVGQTDTLIEKVFNEWSSKKTIGDNLGEESGYEYYRKEYYEIINEWNESTVREDKLKNKAILKNTGELEQELEPQREVSQELQVEKDLYNTDEINLNNDCEMVKIEKTNDGGREIVPVYSVLYDRGESVVITPPTGKNDYSIEKIIIALSGLIIIGTGIIFIKKKILK